jgi:hypothetical protein
MKGKGKTLLTAVAQSRFDVSALQQFPHGQIHYNSSPIRNSIFIFHLDIIDEHSFLYVSPMWYFNTRIDVTEYLMQ